MGVTIHNPDLSLGFVPIGGVQPWLKDYAHTPILPPNWKECDGTQVIDVKSPYNGQFLPDLNGNEYFLKGKPNSGGTGGNKNQSHTYSGVTGFENQAPTGAGPLAGAAPQRHNHNYSGTTSTESILPPYYEVVWIIRIY